jgi:hypothetical protein
MKKLLVLITVLALIAALVVPMAVSASVPLTSSNSVTVTGNMVAPTIALYVPNTFGFSQFAEGDNFANSGAGSVSFAPGSDQHATWTLSATSTTPYDTGKMYSNDTSLFLATPMEVSFDNATWGSLPTGETTPASTNTSSSFSLYAYQNVTQADILNGSGTYSIVVNLMATVAP